LADPERGQPIDGDTLINVWSAGKGVAATTMHALVEQGELEYDAPVTRYWPEYGANGKERATVANLLTHSAGVPQLPPDGTPEQVADVAAMAGWIAQQAPLGPTALRPPASLGNRSDFQDASIPAGVTTTARALARLYAALAAGGEPMTGRRSPGTATPITRRVVEARRPG
jgi:beta-lactamase family protein